MGGRGTGSGLGGGYHVFPDKANGKSHSYGGSGADTVAFFDANSNYNEIIDNSDDDDKSALHYWSNGFFMDGQQYGGWDAMDSSDQEMTQRYDDMLDQSYLSKGIVVSRLSDTQLVLGAGNREGTLSELKNAEGSIVTCKGSMSCAAASEGLSIGSAVGIGAHGGWAGSKNIEYKIHIPGGEKSRGAGMWIGDRRVNGWGPEQREFMTNRDIALRVGKTRLDRSRNIYITDIYFEGLMDHDYGTSGRVSY